MGKVINQTEAVRICKTARRKKQKVVFTNGCFDILHRGHIDLLAKSKKLGDILIVALNTDSSVRKLKGGNRPVMRLIDRAYIISHLKMVDYVVPFGTSTPLSVIKKLQPDVLVKGGDYKLNEIVGAPEVKATGGEIVRIPIVKGYSSSHIMRKIEKL